VGLDKLVEVPGVAFTVGVRIDTVEGVKLARRLEAKLLVVRLLSVIGPVVEVVSDCAGRRLLPGFTISLEGD